MVDFENEKEDRKGDNFEVKKEGDLEKYIEGKYM